MTRPLTTDLRRRRGFSVVDVLVTVAIVAIVVAVALPSMAPDDLARLRGGARMLVSDLEYAQSLSLAMPADPAVIRFAPDGKSYWVARQSDPDAPVERSNGEPYTVVFGGEGQAALLPDVTATFEGVIDETVAFDEFARLTVLDDARITLSTDLLGLTVRVKSSTGAITIE